MTKELAVQNFEPMTVYELRKQVNIIQEALRSVMKEGVHYGKIPGCGDKPALFKAGAEKIILLFRFRPEFDPRRTDLPNLHREYEVKTALFDATGRPLGQGVGSCSTMESKYRWRDQNRKCPKCQKETIFKSKHDDGGFYCWTKKGGCGAKFAIDAKEIIDQVTGKVENNDIADVYNTVLKIGKKRSQTDAVLTCTAASDIFNQDVDERLVESYEPTIDEPLDVTPTPDFEDSQTEMFAYKFTSALQEPQLQYLKKMKAVEQNGLWVCTQKLDTKLDKYLQGAA